VDVFLKHGVETDRGGGVRFQRALSPMMLMKRMMTTTTTVY